MRTGDSSCEPADPQISRFPDKERACMPGSSTSPDRPSACDGAPVRVAFRYTDSVGTRKQFSFAAQWLACTFPYRRFADILADAGARLGADVVRYSFIAVDLHHLLLAGLPAHLCENSERTRQGIQRANESRSDTGCLVLKECLEIPACLLRPRAAGHLFKTNVGFRLGCCRSSFAAEWRRLPKAALHTFSWRAAALLRNLTFAAIVEENRIQ